jgi:CBS domain-containing protein
MEMAIRNMLDARVAGTKDRFPQHPRVERLTVKSVLLGKPSGLHWLSADATSLDALKLMSEHDVGAVLVLDGGRLAGMFCGRDYVHSSVRAPGLAAAIPLRDVMTPCAMFARPTDSVQDCLSLMTHHGWRYLPVQDEGHPIAMVSLEDLLGEMVAYLARVFKENEMDQQIAGLQGTYSC